MIQQLEAKYELYDSVEEMLSPEAMSKILGHRVSNIQTEKFDAAEGTSGSRFSKITVDCWTLVLKFMDPTKEHLAIETGDRQCRSVKLWHYGILDELQPYMNHVTLAACHHKRGYALLMQYVPDGIIEFGHKLDISTIKTLLDAQVEMHVHFWNADELCDPELGLRTTDTLLRMWWPTENNRKLYDTSWYENGWNILFDFLDKDVSDVIQLLMGNPEPFLTKLSEYPSTLIHGDFKPMNFGIMPKTHQLFVLDWQLAAYASPFIDLHWFLNMIEASIVFDPISYYLQQLADRLGNRTNQKMLIPMFELGYLAGVLHMGCFFGSIAYDNQTYASTDVCRKSLPSFNDTVRRGLVWL